MTRAAIRLAIQFSRNIVRGICRRVAMNGTVSRPLMPSQVSAARSRALWELTSTTLSAAMSRASAAAFSRRLCGGSASARTVSPRSRARASTSESGGQTKRTSHPARARPRLRCRVDVTEPAPPP